LFKLKELSDIDSSSNTDTSMSDEEGY